MALARGREVDAVLGRLRPFSANDERREACKEPASGIGIAQIVPPSLHLGGIERARLLRVREISANEQSQELEADEHLMAGHSHLGHAGIYA
jgi:hypothetical protein